MKRDPLSPFAQHGLSAAQEARLAELLDDFAASAVERDRQGGTARRERDLLRASGLLTLAVPAQYGGHGADWRTVLGVVRRMAAVDSSLAHLFAFQHLQVASIVLYGDAHQQAQWLGQTVAQGWFWGNALNPLDTRLVAEIDHCGLVVSGSKGFCSGASDADMLLIGAVPASGGASLVAVVPASHPGITVHGDWDNMGQRQTDSGTVSFARVPIDWDAVLTHPGPGSSPFATLRTCLAQLILVNLYLGLAEGAFTAARHYTRNHARPWPTSGAAAATADPYVLQRFGNMQLQLAAARALADQAVARLDVAWCKGLALGAAERGEVAIAIAQAKLVAARAGLDIAGQLFDVAGARATTASLGLDRFWRNLRTHTLHDSLDYKLREVGDWALNGEFPAPSLYS